MQKRIVLKFGALLVLIVALTAEHSLPSEDSVIQSLDRAQSSIAFNASSSTFRAAGHFDDYVAKISFPRAKPADMNISFRINVRSVVFAPMQPQQQLLLQGLLASLRDPVLDFKSSRVTEIDSRKLRVEGTAVFQEHSHPVSFTVQLPERSSSRTRFSGIVSSDSLNLSSMPLIEQTCGDLSGSAKFELVFNRAA